MARSSVLAEQIKGWEEKEQEEANRLIAQLPEKIKERADQGYNFLHVMTLEWEMGDLSRPKEMCRGDKLEELRGAAASVRDWCQEQDLTVQVAFQPGPCNDGYSLLYIEW